jgi:hypothetical protein
MDSKKLQIYRYRDMIAVQGEGFPTIYLNAIMCHMLSKALQDGAFDILTTPKFSNSNFSDTTLQVN